MHKATHADAAIAPQSGSAVKSTLATLERNAREKGRYWKKNKKKEKGGKGKENAYAAEDSGGGEVSNVVLADLDLAPNNASFHYDMSIMNSPSTYSHSTASDETYLASLNYLKGMAAHQILTGSKAHGHDFHSFGCKAYVFNKNQKTYRIYLSEKHIVVTLIHVKFDHLSFPNTPISNEREYKQLYNMFTSLQSNYANLVSIDDNGIDTLSVPSASAFATDPVKPPPSPVSTPPASTPPASTPPASKSEQPSTPTPFLSPPLSAQHSKAMPKSCPSPSALPLCIHYTAAKKATASLGGDTQPETTYAAVLSFSDNPQMLAQTLNGPGCKYWVEAIKEEL
ncbi:hypothetical protein Moror_6021 [Moniliophthora roreri MCA 2997]|uniref:Uncharacterized protein n=1 Tax=Moniliophthora roreri (strain MCA 2997) TaxID=1381753 RepID=V2W2X1_MONRO|nr:hypothetical protein Moror_6021 [Moniliophthora roreri MCA 2997]